jgi:hypothetical protein
MHNSGEITPRERETVSTSQSSIRVMRGMSAVAQRAKAEAIATKQSTLLALPRYGLLRLRS